MTIEEKIQNDIRFNSVEDKQRAFENGVYSCRAGSNDEAFYALGENCICCAVRDGGSFVCSIVGDDGTIMKDFRIGKDSLKAFGMLSESMQNSFRTRDVLTGKVGFTKNFYNGLEGSYTTLN